MGSFPAGVAVAARHSVPNDFKEDASIGNPVFREHFLDELTERTAKKLLDQLPNQRENEKKSLATHVSAEYLLPS